jgi:peptidoglycan-associated lipoprotein
LNVFLLEIFMRKTLLITAAMAALLAGCASGVKLDSNVPVEDKGGSATTAGVGQNNAQSNVSNVVAERAGQGIGPVGVPHVIYFDYDSFVIRAEARPAIENHARFLQSNKQRKAMLEGHTDERGGREYNLALGQKRAEAVQRALVQLGVPESQIEPVSYGKEKPAAEGADEASWAKNRRVEFKY